MANPEAASDPNVDANPTPAAGETPEGSTEGPQPTDDGNVVHPGDDLSAPGNPVAGPNSEGVQTTDDLR